MGYALKYQAEVEIFDCFKCGCPIALTRVDARRKSHESFYCPNGHGQIFAGESDAEKAARLEKELASARAHVQLAQNNEAAAREDAQRAKDKLARVKNGVCPDCRRSFTNLRRHMATKHGHAK